MITIKYVAQILFGHNLRWRKGCYRGLMLPGGTEVMEHKLAVLMWPQRYVHIKRKYITIKHDTPGVYSTTQFTFHC